MTALQRKALIPWIYLCWTSCNVKTTQRYQILHYPINVSFQQREKPIHKVIPEFSDSGGTSGMEIFGTKAGFDPFAWGIIRQEMLHSELNPSSTFMPIITCAQTLLCPRLPGH